MATPHANMASMPWPTHSTTSRTRPKPSYRTRITIPLRSKPRDYVPGSGPPLPTIQLQPSRDSTAYIIERVLLPSAGSAPNGKPMPKRMTYLIGWHDLPAATLLVPAMKILEYVSPYTLEQWEYQLEEDLDRERAELEEEERNGGTSKRKRKRQRPPANSQIETVNVTEAESVMSAKSRPKAGAMSLTTPQKKRLHDFDAVQRDEDSPSRQIELEVMDSLRRLDTDQAEVVDDSMEEAEDHEGPPSTILPTQTLRPKQSLITNAFGIKVEREETQQMPSTNGWSWTPVHFGNGVQNSQERTVMTLSPAKKPKAAACGRLLASSPVAGSRKELGAPPKPKSQSPMAGSSSQTANPQAKKPKKRPKIEDRDKEKKPQETKKTTVEDNGEPVWVVERLEDVQYYDIEGRLVRYFKVRWEGDWPPEQNPTWEPEENIPETLVKNFMKLTREKKEALRHGGSSARKEKQAKLPWSFGKQYRSVSEAFAGEEEEQQQQQQERDAGGKKGGRSMGLDGAMSPTRGVEIEEQDEFFVVSDDQSRGTSGARKQPHTWNFDLQHHSTGGFISGF